MATGAGWIAGMFGHPVAISLGLRFADRRQVGVDTGGRVGDLLAEELGADKEPAGGGRRIVGFGCKGQEKALAEDTGAF